MATQVESHVALSANNKPRVRIIVPIWGKSYVDNWLTIPFAALNAPDNLPFLGQNCDVEIAIATKRGFESDFLSNCKFREISEKFRTKFIYIDELFPGETKVSYDMPLTLSYAKAVADLGDDATNTYCMIINSDFVLSNGSLRSVYQRMMEGYTIINAPSIRVNEENVRDHLLEIFDRQGGCFSLSSREMMGIVNKNIHGTVRARVLNDECGVVCSHYHLSYWRVSPKTLAARYFLLVPFCFKPERPLTSVNSPIDYGFMPEICPNGKFTVMADSDDFLMMEMQYWHSESRLLLPSADAHFEGRISKIKQQFLTNARTWVTDVHIRNSKEILYYHEDDLPENIDEIIDPFNQFWDDFYKNISPLPHLRHPDWLGAVNYYRGTMYGSGVRQMTPLLDDPQNVIEVVIPQQAANPGRRLAGILRKVILGTQLDSLTVTADIPGNPPLNAMIYLGRTERLLPPLASVTTYHLSDDHAYNPNKELNILLPVQAYEANQPRIGLCAPLAFIPYLGKIKSLCDKALEHDGHVTLVFLVTNDNDLNYIQPTTAVLTYMMDIFPVEQFGYTVDVTNSYRMMTSSFFFFWLLDALGPRFLLRPRNFLRVANYARKFVTSYMRQLASRRSCCPGVGTTSSGGNSGEPVGAVVVRLSSRGLRSAARA